MKSVCLYDPSVNNSSISWRGLRCRSVGVVQVFCIIIMVQLKLHEKGDKCTITIGSREKLTIHIGFMAKFFRYVLQCLKLLCHPNPIFDYLKVTKNVIMSKVAEHSLLKIFF